MDAIELLKRDHQEVTRLFQRYSAGRGGRGARTVDTICRELEVHAQIEEEIFYPAVRYADDELARLVDESLREHGRMKDDIAALRGAGDNESRVMQLQQDVEHHVTEEEGKMFPRLAEVMDDDRRSELGEQLEERKTELSGRAGRSRRQAGPRGAGQRRRTARRARGKSTRTRGRGKAAKSRTTRSRGRQRGAKRASTKGRQRKTGSRRSR
jgi:hemerythrin superfamily protein